MPKLTIVLLLTLPIVFIGGMFLSLKTGWGMHERQIIERVSKVATETKD